MHRSKQDLIESWRFASELGSRSSDMTNFFHVTMLRAGRWRLLTCLAAVALVSAMLGPLAPRTAAQTPTPAAAGRRSVSEIDDAATQKGKKDRVPLIMVDL